MSISTSTPETNLLSLLDIAKLTWPRAQRMNPDGTFHDWCERLWLNREGMRVITADGFLCGMIVALSDGDGTLTVKELVCLRKGTVHEIIERLPEFYGPVNTVVSRRRGKLKRFVYEKLRSNANKLRES